eukprot:c13106_g1_i1 orf=18-305(-)
MVLGKPILTYGTILESLRPKGRRKGSVATLPISSCLCMWCVYVHACTEVCMYICMYVHVYAREGGLLMLYYKSPCHIKFVRYSQRLLVFVCAHAV